MYGENLYLFFGLPGCGKTTLLCSFALKHLKNGCNVYTNIPLAITHDNYYVINNSDIGKYNLHNGVLLIDEGTLFANNRDYKEFSKNLTRFFMLHRHYGLDIYIFAQTFDGVDKKIRTISTALYYVKKSLFGTTYYYHIPYGLDIPNKKTLKATGVKFGEINEGYCDATLLQKIFSPRIIRKKYYRYFDSYEAPELPELPNCTKNSTVSNTNCIGNSIASKMSQKLIISQMQGLLPELNKHKNE